MLDKHIYVFGIGDMLHVQGNIVNMNCINAKVKLQQFTENIKIITILYLQVKVKLYI